MRTLWKGSIAFGLVTIPVSLYPATRREDLKFRMLRRTDLSPINYKRIAEADGREVPWDEIVKGYEYKKGKFVPIDEEDFARVDVQGTQTVNIINFVSMEDVGPLLFYKPYYLEVGKGGDKAYLLLRDALVKSGKIAIAKVVIRVREHLAAIKPRNGGLILELMHFPQELIELSQFKKPSVRSVSKPELRMAEQLIDSMTARWKPEMYRDYYHDTFQKLIQEKIKRGGKSAPHPGKKKKQSNVIDLVSVLQQSIRESKSRKTPKRKHKHAA